jgi:cell division protein FtsB
MSLIKELEELVEEVRKMKEEGATREEAIQYLREQCRIRRGYAAIADEVYKHKETTED